MEGKEAGREVIRQDSIIKRKCYIILLGEKAT